MRILLTGSSGYIGTSLRERLGRRFSFIEFDIRKNPRDDVRDLARLKLAVKKVDGVLHLAAISRPKWGYTDPHLCLTTNILGTLNVLEAVRQVNPRVWVILGSSREVFGNLKKHPGNENSPRSPLNAYGVSKVAGEDLLKQYASNYGLRCLALRFCGVYTGKKDILDRVIPRFILQALRGVPITIEGDGRKKFDFVYIDDVCHGIAEAMRFISSKSPSFYDDITLARQSPVSIANLARLIIKASSSKSTLDFQPNRTYDQEGYWGTYAKAQKLLGWKPKVTLEEGLEKSVKELKN